MAGWKTVLIFSQDAVVQVVNGEGMSTGPSCWYPINVKVQYEADSISLLGRTVDRLAWQ
jgi:hypothetical protein